MKKFILALCLILLPTLAWAAGVMMMGSGTPAAAPPADGLIGNSADGGSYGVGAHMHWCAYTTTTAGTISYIRIKLASVWTGNKINAGLYTAAGAKIVDGTGVGGDNSTPQLVVITLDSPTAIEAATSYILACWVADTDYNIYTTTNAGFTTYYTTTVAGTGGDTMPANLPASDGSYANTDLIFYGNNTAP